MLSVCRCSAVCSVRIKHRLACVELLMAMFGLLKLCCGCLVASAGSCCGVLCYDMRPKHLYPASQNNARHGSALAQLPALLCVTSPPASSPRHACKARTMEAALVEAMSCVGKRQGNHFTQQRPAHDGHLLPTLLTCLLTCCPRGPCAHITRCPAAQPTHQSEWRTV